MYAPGGSGNVSAGGSSVFGFCVRYLCAGLVSVLGVRCLVYGVCGRYLRSLFPFGIFVRYLCPISLFGVCVRRPVSVFDSVVRRYRCAIRYLCPVLFFLCLFFRWRSSVAVFGIGVWSVHVNVRLPCWAFVIVFSVSSFASGVR